ncbi:54S ribosomal protein L23, mitochondrial [Kappamyces sp. JEL0680]|nr:54S ribosomal protein L23, mitochondrial [Kappamyces sp. JEL0680]
MLKVDAKDKVLGKLAQRIAIALRGKYKPHYNPAVLNNIVDVGDYVVVKNTRWVGLTGNKTTQKTYSWHSGYPGALTTKKYDEFIEQHPSGVWMRRLKLFPDEDHPHKANIFKCHDPLDPLYKLHNNK